MRFAPVVCFAVYATVFACGGTAVRDEEPRGVGASSGSGGASVGGGGPSVGGVPGGGGAPGGGGSPSGGAPATGYWNTCFVAGTAIATPSGDVAIEALRPGDLVLAYDVARARTTPRPVARTFRHENQIAGRLITHGGRSLGVTAEHPIYRADHDDYVPASAVTRDTRLVRLESGGVTSDIAREFVALQGSVPEPVFNIEVADLHNYFANGVLVHNKSGAGGGSCKDLLQVNYSSSCDPSLPCMTPLSPAGGGAAGAGPTMDGAAPFDAGAQDGGKQDGAASVDAGGFPDSGGGDAGGSIFRERSTATCAWPRSAALGTSSVFPS